MSKSMYVIRSVVNPAMDYTILADSKGSLGPKVTAETIFQKCDVANANGHKFPRKTLSLAIEKLKDDIDNRHFLGELDHPEDISDVNRIATVSLKNSSHVITELHLDGAYVVGKFETIDTPNGAILSSLLRDKIKVGVSIRAITDQNITYGGDTDTITDFNLIAYDAVHNPAYSDAYVNSIMASVFKISDSEVPKKLITLSEDELKDVISNAILATLKKVYKN